MTKKYFGTDGIRGAINSENINGDMFFKFGLASGTYFKSQKKRKQTAIIAKDTRLSGYTLEPALVSGLASAGMHIYTLGPLPTNGLAMLTKKMRANMGIMITASHNPYFFSLPSLSQHCKNFISINNCTFFVTDNNSIRITIKSNPYMSLSFFCHLTNFFWISRTRFEINV